MKSMRSETLACASGTARDFVIKRAIDVAAASRKRRTVRGGGQQRRGGQHLQKRIGG